MTGPEHLYWDSCVFIRYLTESPPDRVDDIARLITDAQRGNRKIYYSTISYVEIRPRYLKASGHLSIQNFFSDFRKAFNPIEPNPNILIQAGELRDVSPVNPAGADKEHSRVIGTPDAINLMTCLHVRDVLGISDIVFHTFDKGRGTTWEGKCVPLIGFEKWFPEASRVGHVAKVCDLERTEPLHPNPDLLSGGGNA